MRYHCSTDCAPDYDFCDVKVGGVFEVTRTVPPTEAASGVYVKLDSRRAMKIDGTGTMLQVSGRDRVFVCQPSQIILTLNRD